MSLLGQESGPHWLNGWPLQTAASCRAADGKHYPVLPQAASSHLRQEPVLVLRQRVPDVRIPAALRCSCQLGLAASTALHLREAGWLLPTTPCSCSSCCSIDGNNAGGNQAKYQLARVTADADKGSWRLQVGLPLPGWPSAACEQLLRVSLLALTPWQP